MPHSRIMGFTNGTHYFGGIPKTPIGVLCTLLSLLAVYKTWLAIQLVQEKE